ncbi:MAG: (d)CMP kinase [Victivallales bacterium]|jgi:cytidylate kinase|nr:(d)CMP kinase [Victivallales bacterium]
MTLQIAIDGPAASGKSTDAKLLAERINGLYVNTGLMYRAIAGAAYNLHIDPEKNPQELVKLLPQWTLEYRLDNENKKLELFFNDKPVDNAFLRSKEVSDVVSQVAAIPEVRDWMLQKQRDCAKLPIIIMEGRDIQTVVLPNATYKFFITASPEERARRRLKQGDFKDGTTLKEVAEQIKLRDHLDSTRAVAPLKPAADSLVINTDNMTPDEVVDKMVEHMQKNPRQ